MTNPSYRSSLLSGSYIVALISRSWEYPLILLSPSIIATRGDYK